MPKKYFLLLCLFSFITNAQIINFPNDQLKATLLKGDTYSPYSIAKNLEGHFFKIDSNNDYEIDINEASHVSYLNLSSYHFSNLDGLENFTNLKELNCSNNILTSLNLSHFPNLEILDCNTNRLTSLNLSTQAHITEIICHHNYLTSIVVKDQNPISKLICYSNEFSTLNLDNFLKIKELNCSGNRLTSLDLNNLKELVTLDLGYNKIASIELDNLSNLRTLILESNLFTNIYFPNNPKLTSLYFSYNQVKNVNIKNLTELEYLYCGNNSISNLDLENNKLLSSLSFEVNKLTSIDLSNQNLLIHLNCSSNTLASLDLSNQKSLLSLDCSYNKITFLNLKNGSTEFFNATGNALKFLCIDEEDEYTAGNYLTSSHIYNCSLNSYCSFTPSGAFYTIQGNQILDTNTNGCDELDRDFPNLNFSITNQTIKKNFISDNSGNFTVPVGEGTYSITPLLENPNYFTIIPESVTVTFPNETSPSIQNFCITPKGEHQDIEVTILSVLPARPGFDATYKIIYKNKANKTVSGTVTLDFNDTVLDYISSIPTITNQSFNKLLWDYTDLKPLETKEIEVTLNVNSPMETPAVNINDRLSFNALITPVKHDELPVDNSFALRQIVVGSYDPNDKTCLEGDVITPELIGEYVHYLIRFENTGTYPAENVVVRDWIDLSKFDISTLTLTKASHPYVTKISNGSKVEFIFEKINLPFDDAHNDGYIAFKIKTLPTLTVGDSFSNEANIYFDYNFPILTNKATSTFKTLGVQDFQFSKYFSIYPNPAVDFLNISSKESTTILSMKVYDILGQLVIAIPNAQSTSKVDVSKLGTGNYFLKIKSDKGTSGVKFIKK
ncbi:leucine-rich repeat domain-containing protein [Flavobacterium sp. ABG]|uniref:DUF7619 domain-containing protein n=1 Tax=Flavobacterium sp. ABG TaxID=1423322 RepID=UPI00064A9D2B|nr:leucine-rich repeat domain-containing protein [Flavobacterium sp. ABG]KLT70393.1 internalin [Flavobacterium sp. ABG]